MFTITYNRKENEYKIEVDKLVTFSKKQLPLKASFEKTVTGEEGWSADLFESGWASWRGGDTPYNIRITTALGEQVYYWEFDPARDGDPIEKTLWHFITSLHTRPKGAVIGSHDGLFGHWVFPVMHNLTDVLIVDGTESSLKAAELHYAGRASAKFIKEIVTPDGSDVVWYTGGEGYTDTVIKEVIQKFLPDDKIVKVSLPSKSINTLFKELSITELDWLHLDVEGLDADLILAMDIRPTVIIFETEHLPLNKRLLLLDWFKQNNYSFIEHDKNGLAVNKNQS